MFVANSPLSLPYESVLILTTGYSVISGKTFTTCSIVLVHRNTELFVTTGRLLITNTLSMKGIRKS